MRRVAIAALAGLLWMGEVRAIPPAALAVGTVTAAGTAGFAWLRHLDRAPPHWERIPLPEEPAPGPALVLFYGTSDHLGKDALMLNHVEKGEEPPQGLNLLWKLHRAAREANLPVTIINGVGSNDFGDGRLVRPRYFPGPIAKPVGFGLSQNVDQALAWILGRREKGFEDAESAVHARQAMGGEFTSVILVGHSRGAITAHVAAQSPCPGGTAPPNPPSRPRPGGGPGRPR